jgi:hypothetical protein
VTVAEPNSERDGSLEQLRQRPINAHLAKGFGPLVVGVILFILMVLLAPTVAPERIVEEPVNTTTTLSLEAELIP